MQVFTPEWSCQCIRRRIGTLAAASEASCLTRASTACWWCQRWSDKSRLSAHQPKRIKSWPIVSRNWQRPGANGMPVVSYEHSNHSILKYLKHFNWMLQIQSRVIKLFWYFFMRLAPYDILSPATYFYFNVGWYSRKGKAAQLTFADRLLLMSWISSMMTSWKPLAPLPSTSSVK